MKHKSLILKEEVTRILEMMNIDSQKSQVLNESIIDDIIGLAVKYGVKSADDVATKIAKLEKELNIPKGTLNKDDIAKLAKGGVEAESVVVKIVNNLNSTDLTKLAKKVWGQLGGDVHKNAMNIIDGLKTSGKKYTSSDAMDYLNKMSETLIKSDNQINDLVVALRKEFVDRSYNSLKTSGVIDDVVGVSSKTTNISDELSNAMDNLKNKIGDIPDNISSDELMVVVNKLMDEFKLKLPPSIATDTLKKQMADEIQTILKRPTPIDEVERAFLGASPARQAEILKTTIKKLDNQIDKTPNWFKKQWEIEKNKFKSPRALWTWYKTRLLASVVYYMAIDCGSKALDTKSESEDIKKTAKACGANVIKSLFWMVAIPRDIWSWFTEDEEGGETETTSSETTNFTGDLSGCIKFAATKGKRCEKDGTGGFIIYSEDNVDEITPVAFESGNWVEL
jgi:hypothetical protein